MSVRMVATWGQSERGEALRTERAILPGFLLCLLAFVRVPCADGQLETSQIPVEATVSSEPVKMQANAPPEGLIHLDVAATDREGKPFSRLAAKDFTLMDNGVPQKIVSFAASNEATDENERLNEVVLVLDEVNLSHLQFETVKDESIKVLRQKGGHLAQPACGVSRCSIEFFDWQALLGQLVHDWEPYQQIFPFNKQQEHLAEPQELFMVNVPVLDHSRLHES